MSGFFRIAGAIPKLHLADPVRNGNEILKLYRQAENADAALLAVPELALTGYSCGDLFEQEILLQSAERELCRLAENTGKCILICGFPLKIGHALFNTACVMQNRRIFGFAVKEFLPDTREFYEKRQFCGAAELPCDEVRFGDRMIPVGNDLLFDAGNTLRFGAELCEDLWSVAPPSNDLALAGAQLIVNLSASNAVAGKAKFRRKLVEMTSYRLHAMYTFVGAGVYESTSDLVFDGQLLMAINGETLPAPDRFQRESAISFADFKPSRIDHIRRANASFRALRPAKKIRRVPLAAPTECTPYCDDAVCRIFPEDPRERQAFCEEILEIQSHALATRLERACAEKMIVGVSGGIDSTLALIVCAKCCDLLKMPRERIIGVSMPGFASGKTSQTHAAMLMKALCVSARTIPISDAVSLHLESISHDGKADITYQNAQARERTKILMDVANQEKGLVIGTGDLSELALGWCTYNADQMAMYNVNASLLKTLVRQVVSAYAANSNEQLKNLLMNILSQPFSPELVPGAPPTETQIGSYELHDFFLWHFLRYGETPQEILEAAMTAFGGIYSAGECRTTLAIFLRRFFGQQFKRDPMPDGPKVTELSLSPRGDWRMPSDAAPEIWLAQLNALKTKE